MQHRFEADWEPHICVSSGILVHLRVPTWSQQPAFQWYLGLNKLWLRNNTLAKIPGNPSHSNAHSPFDPIPSTSSKTYLPSTWMMSTVLPMFLQLQGVQKDLDIRMWEIRWVGTASANLAANFNEILRLIKRDSIPLLDVIIELQLWENSAVMACAVKVRRPAVWAAESILVFLLDVCRLIFSGLPQEMNSITGWVSPNDCLVWGLQTAKSYHHVCHYAQ